MNQTFLAAAISLPCLALVYALMAAGNARAADLGLVAAAACLAAAACAFALLMPSKRGEPCKRPYA